MIGKLRSVVLRRRRPLTSGQHLQAHLDLSLYSAANSKSAPLVLSAAATKNTVAHTAQADSSHSESPEVGVHEGQPALRQRNGFLRHERLAHEGSQVKGALADAVVGAHLPVQVTNRLN